MRRHTWIAVTLALAIAGACTTEKPAPAKVDQSSPQALAESIFAAARDGNLAALENIAAPDADGDSKDVAGVAKAAAKQQQDFRDHFSKVKVNGDVKLEGDKAEVPILFGPDGAKAETLVMVKVNGLWTLQSF